MKKIDVPCPVYQVFSRIRTMRFLSMNEMPEKTVEMACYKTQEYYRENKAIEFFNENVLKAGVKLTPSQKSTIMKKVKFQYSISHVITELEVKEISSGSVQVSFTAYPEKHVGKFMDSFETFIVGKRGGLRHEYRR